MRSDVLVETETERSITLRFSKASGVQSAIKIYVHGMIMLLSEDG